MRATHCLGMLTMLTLLSAGCIATDYGAINPELNKTTSIIGCASGSVFNTTVQTIVPQTQQLLYTQRFPNGDAVCTGNGPVATVQRLSRQDAMDLNFCASTFAPLGEISVTSAGYVGTWVMAGVKDMADGTVRLNTWFAPGVLRPASCVGSGIDPSGPESSIIGDGFAERPFPARLPGLRVEGVAIDRAPGAGCRLCANVVAMHPARVRDNFSSYVCTNARGTENRVRFTPQCRQEGELVPVLSGQPITLELDGVRITGRARLDDQGQVIAELLGLENGGVKYEAISPVWFRLDPNRGLSHIEVNPSLDEMRRLARFTLDAQLADRPLKIGGITDYGVMLPDVTVLISSAALESFLAGGTSAGDEGDDGGNR